MGNSSVNILSLCAGAAGLDLGVSIAEPGARVYGYVEWEAYAAAVLLARMEEQSLDAAPVWCGDIRDFDVRPFRGHLDMVISGDPCVANSVAGLRKGQDDDRWLLDRVLEIFDQSGAHTFFRENVAGNSDGQLGVLVPALERMGCTVAAGIFSAAEVGASHRRERLFVLAHRNGGERSTNSGEPDTRTDGRHDAGGRGQDVAHREGGGFGEGRGAQEPGRGGHADGGEQAVGNAERAKRRTGEPTGDVGNRHDTGRTQETGGTGKSGSELGDAELARRAQAGAGFEVDAGRKSVKGRSAVADAAGTRHGAGRSEPGGPLRDETRRAEPDGRCAGVADAESDIGRGEQQAGAARRGRGGPAGTGEAVADAGGDRSTAGISGPDAGQEGFTGIANHGGYEIPIFAPGPADSRWPAILESAPHLEPAVCDLASRYADWMGGPGNPARVDQLRLLGNAVVPIAAAFAYSTLRETLRASEPVLMEAAEYPTSSPA